MPVTDETIEVVPLQTRPKSPPVHPAIQKQKEPIQAVSVLPEVKHFKAAPLKEGLTDFVYQDGEPILLRVKPTSLLYKVIPMNEDCKSAGYCRHDLMPGGWCKHSPIFIDREHISYCRARNPANSQSPDGGLILAVSGRD